MRYPRKERRRIRTLRRQQPELSELLDFLEKVAEIGERSDGERFDRGRLPSPIAGVPPLFPGDFPLDERRAAETFAELAGAFHDATGNPSAGRARTALEGGRLDARSLVRAYCASDNRPFEKAADRLEGVDPELLVQLAELAVKPQFVAAARALGGDLRLPDAHERADRCPACGSPPDLAYITDREDAERIAVAVCRLCETEWPIRRIRCLSCGNEDVETLSYLQAEGEEDTRVNVCLVCQGYLPVVDARGRLEIAPTVERAGLAYLDVVAQERGYEPPSSLLARTAGRMAN